MAGGGGGWGWGGAHSHSELESAGNRSFSVEQALPDGRTRIGKVKLAPQGNEAVDKANNALVITGHALIHALADYPDKFLKLGEFCISVRRACRVKGKWQPTLREGTLHGRNSSNGRPCET